MEAIMNDAELDQRLKAARGPALEPDYVEDFPRLVLAHLCSTPQRAVQLRPDWWPQLAWGFAIALCLLVAFAAGHWHGRMAADKDVLADSKLIQETLAMFPHRVRAIVRDEHGMNLVLSDKEDVPASTPIYVRICDGQNCSSLVTFSGQEIQIAGQKVTVLSEADGGIILEGSKFAWSNKEWIGVGARLKIEARNLNPATM
jgi:hypothetical protein